MVNNAQEEIRDRRLPEYNTEQKQLALPGYGRNIQNMVDYCMSIKDRDERTRCAYSIISTIEKLREVNIPNHTLWDHLYFMSGYQLDIDYPNGYQPVKIEALQTAPKQIPYPQKSFRFRHYGFNIQEIIEKAIEMEPGQERDLLVFQIANQMKRSYVLFNKDSVTDVKIFDDLRELSRGQIEIHAEDMQLLDAQKIKAAAAAVKNENKQGKKKKKK
jgi:hypothetical protein